MEYTFTLKYQLPAVDREPGATVERLADAGCDDALAGIGRPGRLALEFTREAATAKHAVHSALEDVQRAVPGARLVEAAPDFVGLSDVAELVGVSRQNMRKLMLTHSDSFPAPVHEGSAAIWHLADLLAWLRDRAGYLVDPAAMELAQVILQVNVARERHRLQRAFDRKLDGLVR